MSHEISQLPADNHVHTEWSWDTSAAASMARSCEQALKTGLPSVAFTDHLDIADPAPDDRAAAENLSTRRYRGMRLTDIDGYLNSVRECRERFPGLRIWSGAELGEAHLFAASIQRAAASAGFDRLLGSVHAIPLDGELVAAENLFGRLPAPDVMPRYFAEVIRLIEGSSLFQVLAHLDYPRRVWPSGAGPYDERRFEEEYRAVLRALAGSDRVLELNTKSPLASVRLLGWWRDAGGRAISFGSDAHRPGRIGDRFREAAAIATAAGFRPGPDPDGFWGRG